MLCVLTDFLNDVNFITTGTGSKVNLKIESEIRFLEYFVAVWNFKWNDKRPTRIELVFYRKYLFTFF